MYNLYFYKASNESGSPRSVADITDGAVGGAVGGVVGGAIILIIFAACVYVVGIRQSCRKRYNANRK